MLHFLEIPCSKGRGSFKPLETLWIKDVVPLRKRKHWGREWQRSGIITELRLHLNPSARFVGENCENFLSLQKAPRIILDVTRLSEVVSLKSVARIQTGRFSDSGNLYASTETICV